jgi:hypothetical protein
MGRIGARNEATRQTGFAVGRVGRVQAEVHGAVAGESVIPREKRELRAKIRNVAPVVTIFSSQVCVPTCPARGISRFPFRKE